MDAGGTGPRLRATAHKTICKICTWLVEIRTTKYTRILLMYTPQKNTSSSTSQIWLALQVGSARGLRRLGISPAPHGHPHMHRWSGGAQSRASKALRGIEGQLPLPSPSPSSKKKGSGAGLPAGGFER